MNRNLPDEVKGYDITLATNILMTDDQYTDPVLCDFYWLYSRVNPLAVEFFIHHAGRGEAAKWAVSRDLVSAAAIGGIPSGEGDFKIEVNTRYPLITHTGTDAEETLLLHLDGLDSDGFSFHAHGFVMRSATQFFLRKTTSLVPVGGEKYDIDGLINQLLGV